MRFAYARFRHGATAPIIPIRVRGRRRWHTIDVYVDSGAFCSILRPEEARRLGAEELVAQPVKIATSGGRTMALKLYRLAAKIGTWRGVVTFGVPQGFDIEFNLLGRKDVFEQFIISFDEAAATVTFRPRRR